MMTPSRVAGVVWNALPGAFRPGALTAPIVAVAGRRSAGRARCRGAVGAASARARSAWRRAVVPVLAAVVLSCLAMQAARATDEIKVFTGEINEPGQISFAEHFNYAFSGRKDADFPGGLVPNHALNGTPEFAYGVNEWMELGFYLPFAVNSGDQFLSDGFKFRTLFVTPQAEHRAVFYGVNLDYSYATPPFSQTRFGIAVRPILGWRNAGFELIVNPIFEFGLGSQGDTDFKPAARFARKADENFAVGLEYYSDLGRPGAWLPARLQQHQLFAVTDFKAGIFNIDLGIGYGLTPGSDRLVAKAILEYRFPAPGEGHGEEHGGEPLKAPPTAHAGPRMSPTTPFAADPFSGLR